jgi:hypothetical protein
MHSLNHVPDIVQFVNKRLYGLNARAPCRSGSPGHQTGVTKELISSEGVVCSSSRSK